MRAKTSGLVGVAMAIAGCTAGESARELQPRFGTPGAAGGGLSVLVFSRTEGFRHASIDVAVPALQQMGTAHGWTVEATEDPAVFVLGDLLAYDVVAFVNTTGDVLDDAQQQAFEEYMAMGRGYVGVHSATDTEFDWPFYGEMLGGYFDGHPAPQEASIEVVDAGHASTQHLGMTWVRFDEWYNFDPNPSATVDVLLRLDESTYDGGTMGKDHPIAWTRELGGGGRVFYTGGGHTGESWAEEEFLAHVQGGIQWAAGSGEMGGTTSTGSSGSSEGGGSSGGDEGSTSGVPGSSGGPGETSNGAGGSSSGASSSGATSSTGVAEDGPIDEKSDDGCGCRARPEGTTAFWWLMLVAVRPRSRFRGSRLPPVRPGGTAVRCRDRRDAAR